MADLAEVRTVVKLAEVAEMAVKASTAATAGSLPQDLNRRHIRLIVTRWPLQVLVR